MILETKRLILRPWEESDAEKSFNSIFLLYTLKDRIMTDYSSIASGTTFAEKAPFTGAFLIWLSFHLHITSIMISFFLSSILPSDSFPLTLTVTSFPQPVTEMSILDPLNLSPLRLMSLSE